MPAGQAPFGSARARATQLGFPAAGARHHRQERAALAAPDAEGEKKSSVTDLEVGVIDDPDTPA
jgi:hypothetical protein